MSNPLTASQAYAKAVAALEYLRKEIQYHIVIDKEVPAFCEQIENVSMIGLLELQKVFDFGRQRLFMPHELDHNTMMLIWNPFPGCVISIESEPLSKVEIDLKPFNFN